VGDFDFGFLEKEWLRARAGELFAEMDKIYRWYVANHLQARMAELHSATSAAMQPTTDDQEIVLVMGIQLRAHAEATMFAVAAALAKHEFRPDPPDS
jgi:hypothetical protein